MERNLTEQEIEKIINLGALEYNSEMCAQVLNIDKSIIDKFFLDKKFEFYKNYQKGNIRAQYVVDLKLFELAQQGDIKAMDKLAARKKTRTLNSK